MIFDRLRRLFRQPEAVGESKPFSSEGNHMRIYQMKPGYAKSGGRRGWVDGSNDIWETEFNDPTSLLKGWSKTHTFDYKGSGKPIDIMVDGACIYVSERVRLVLEGAIDSPVEFLPVSLGSAGQYYVLHPLSSVLLAETTYDDQGDPKVFAFAEAPSDFFLIRRGKGALKISQGMCLPRAFASERFRDLLSEFGDVDWHLVYGEPSSGAESAVEETARDIAEPPECEYTLAPPALPGTHFADISGMAAKDLPEECLLADVPDIEALNVRLRQYGCGEDPWPDSYVAIGHDGSGNVFYWDGEAYGFYDHENGVPSPIGDSNALEAWLNRVYG